MDKFSTILRTKHEMVDCEWWVHVKSGEQKVSTEIGYVPISISRES